MSLYRELGVFTAKTSIVTTSVFIIPVLLCSLFSQDVPKPSNKLFTNYKHTNKICDQSVIDICKRINTNINTSLKSSSNNKEESKKETDVKEEKDETDLKENKEENKEENKNEKEENKEDTNPIESKEQNIYDLLLESNDTTFIIYHFNNYDDTDDDDEFMKLQKFTSIIIKSFQKRYKDIIVLLKISSPGGSALDFMQAYDNIKRLRENGVRVFAFVDDIAASGGYMLACACEKIICSKYSCIGSIGVVMQLHNYSELSKKIGIEEKTWTTGKYKRPFPTGAPYTEENNQLIKESLNDTFEIFKSMVESSRNLTDEQKEVIFTANTFTGIKSLSLNIVDFIDTSETVFNNLVSNGNNVWIYNNVKKNDLSNIINSIFDLSNLLHNTVNNIIKLFDNSNKHKQIKFI